MLRLALITLLPILAMAEPYKRSAFTHWSDLDSDCQNARAETLLNSSLAPALLDDKGCRVVAGVWKDPYTGEWFSEAKDLDIDHIVPLKAAWESGADQWSKFKRKEFANDPDNLLAVKASANRRKGAKTPVYWMPPRKSYHCEYVLRWLMVKTKYKLRTSWREWTKLSVCTGNFSRTSTSHQIPPYEAQL